MLDELLNWDRRTLVYLNNLGNQEYDGLWIFITQIYTWIPLFAFLIFLIYKNHSKRFAKRILLAFAATLTSILLLMILVKEGIGRLRPNNDAAVNELLRLNINPSSFSFFSGHAATSFGITLLTILFLRKKTKWVYLLFLWPLLFSYSRLYLGVHFPSDILVGMLVGLSVAALFYRLFKKFKEPYLG